MGDVKGRKKKKNLLQATAKRTTKDVSGRTRRKGRGEGAFSQRETFRGEGGGRNLPHLKETSNYSGENYLIPNTTKKKKKGGKEKKKSLLEGGPHPRDKSS